MPSDRWQNDNKPTTTDKEIIRTASGNSKIGRRRQRSSGASNENPTKNNSEVQQRTELEA